MKFAEQQESMLAQMKIVKDTSEADVNSVNKVA